MAERHGGWQRKRSMMVVVVIPDSEDSPASPLRLFAGWLAAVGLSSASPLRWRLFPCSNGDSQDEAAAAAAGGGDLDVRPVAPAGCSSTWGSLGSASALIAGWPDELLLQEDSKVLGSI